MHLRAYELALSIAILGPTALTVLPGCDSSGNLGDGRPDTAVGLGGSTTGPSGSGGASPTGGAGQAGSSGSGGAGLAGSSGLGQGGTPGTGSSGQGGGLGTGGSSQSGDAGISGVTLTVSVTGDGYLVPVWHNQSPVSIFLYGCGTADVWKKDGSNWVNRGRLVACAWEGVSPEVASGATYSDVGPGYAVASGFGAGTYRVQGKYGVGCTNPELGQSKAGCTAFYEAISNEVTVAALPDAGAGGTGGKGGTTGKGGATGTGGTTGTGGITPVWDGGVTGVNLVTSIISDGGVVPVWQNRSEASIFLYGCGTANVWKKDGSSWVNYGAGVNCAWEGVSPEVQAGTTYPPELTATYGIPVAKLWGPGTYRLQGRYGIGCTHPELGQSKAECTAYYDAISNEVTLAALPDGGAGGAGGSVDAGTGGTGGVTGVYLLGFNSSEGGLVARWQNDSQVSIFLYGCGTATLWQQKADSSWTDLGPAAVCNWEGGSPEVKPGETYSDNGYASRSLWVNGSETYRFTGKYGVGCTHPELGQSKAECTAFYEATSYPISVHTAAADAGSSVDGN